MPPPTPLLTDQLPLIFNCLDDMVRHPPRDSAPSAPVALARWERIAIAAILAVFIVILGLMLLGAAWPGASAAAVRDVARGFFLVQLLLSLLYLCSICLSGMVMLRRAHRRQQAGVMATLGHGVWQDAQSIQRLWSFDQATLAYALIQYRQHWSQLDGRTALLAGKLREFGLMPALAAAAISANTLLKDGSNVYLWGPLCVAVAFYLLAFIATTSRERAWHVVALLEYAVAHAGAPLAHPARSSREAGRE